MAHEEIRLDRRIMVRSEIDTAITALAAGDYVSSHVLAFAAKAQLRGIAGARRIETFDDEAEVYIKPEFLGDYRKLMNDAYNVFKHATDDPDRELPAFRPETTVIAIFTAIVNYGLVYGQRSVPMVIVYAWFLSRHPNFAKPALHANIQQWKRAFDDPEGKPLAEALGSLRKMVAAVDGASEQFIRMLNPEAAIHIEP